jgi:hypothetical protein
MVDLNDRLLLLASGDFVLTQGEDGKMFGLQFSERQGARWCSYSEECQVVFVCGGYKVLHADSWRERRSSLVCVVRYQRAPVRL